MHHLLIGELAERAGVAAPTIRYYERIGLLKHPVRSSAGYRHYSEASVEELRFIKKAQGLGFSLDEIGEILKLARSGTVPCTRVLSLAHKHLAAVEARIRQLQEFRDRLADEVRKWDQQTVTACDGLCQLIVAADSVGNPLALHLSPPQRSPRKMRT